MLFSGTQPPYAKSVTASSLFIVEQNYLDDRARVKLTRIVFPGSIEKLLGEQQGCRRQTCEREKIGRSRTFPPFQNV